MSDNNSKINSMDAFSAFRKKMERFIASGQESPKKQKSALQTIINESDEEHRQRILNGYQQFLTPKDSETSLDELSLIASHKLYLAAQELNASSQKENASRLGSGVPLLASIEINTPLAKKDRYQHGNDLYYLRTWFFYEQQVSDVIPVMENGKLIFLSAETFSFSPEEKEIRAIVAQA